MRCPQAATPEWPRSPEFCARHSSGAEAGEGSRGGAAATGAGGEGAKPEEGGARRPEESGQRGSGGWKGAQPTGRVGLAFWGRAAEATDHALSAERYRGHIGASLIVGGFDVMGPQLYCVHPHGSYSRLPFTAMGERSCHLLMSPAPATLTSCVCCVRSSAV